MEEEEDDDEGVYFSQERDILSQHPSQTDITACTEQGNLVDHMEPLLHRSFQCALHAIGEG